MLESTKARDIMIPLDRYPHVPYWFTIRQAVTEIERVQLKIGDRQSLPRMVLIFDEEYRLMGMARRRDLLRGLGADALQEPRERNGENDPSRRRDVGTVQPAAGNSVQHIRERAERPVQEIMSNIRVTVRSDSSIPEVMQTLVVNNISFAPVLDHDGVVGVVRTADVLHFLSQFIE